MNTNKAELKKFVSNLGKYTLTDSSYVCLARHCKMIQVGSKMTYRATSPIYPESPKTVRICANFIERSALFTIDTDNKVLISQLRKAMWKNKQAARA